MDRSIRKCEKDDDIRPNFGSSEGHLFILILYLQSLFQIRRRVHTILMLAVIITWEAQGTGLTDATT